MKADKKKVVQILKDAKARIATPETWTQGSFARSEGGDMLFSLDERAVCWCSSGALTLAAPGNFLERHECVKWLNRGTCDPAKWERGNYIRFQDAHTHEEVMAMWDRAIQLAEEDADAEV